MSSSENGSLLSERISEMTGARIESVSVPGLPLGSQEAKPEHGCRRRRFFSKSKCFCRLHNGGHVTASRQLGCCSSIFASTSSSDLDKRDYSFTRMTTTRTTTMINIDGKSVIRKSLAVRSIFLKFVGQVTEVNHLV